MKLITPSYEIIPQQSDLEGVYKQVELAGRTCYKSEDKITPDSSKSFVERMIKSGHGAMLEHGTIYLSIHFKQNDDSNNIGYSYWDKYNKNKYSKVNQIQTIFIKGASEGYVAITTNLRVLVENNWLDDLQYICEPTEYHEKRISVRFICDRGVSHEFVRHRVFSFAQESTRYCNYSKDKFGNELTFIIPCWYKIYEGGKKEYAGSPEYNFDAGLAYCEENYLNLLENGWTPQQARSILPNSLKTELVMTGFISDWKHFFELRCANSAHPQARELAIPLEEEFKRLNYE